MYASGNVTEVISSPMTAEIQTQCINTIKTKIRNLYVLEIAVVSCNVKFGKHCGSAEHHVENNYCFCQTRLGMEK